MVIVLALFLSLDKFCETHIPETTKTDFKINKNALGPLLIAKKNHICRPYVTKKMVLRHKTRHAWMDW